MKKPTVLIVLSAIFFPAICLAGGKNGITFAEALEDGRYARFTISENKAIFECGFDEKAEMSRLKIEFGAVGGGYSADLVVFFENDRPFSFVLDFFKDKADEGKFFIFDVDIKAHKAAFAKIIRLKQKLAEKYGLYEAARKMMAEQRVKFVAKEKARREKEEAEKKKMPAPTELLDKLLK